MTDLEIPETGAVFTFGKSRFAENKPSHFFIKNDPVIHVTCGDEHTAVICKNGRIFAFGSNEWGQLGLGHNNMVHKPSCVKALKPDKAKFIACGRAHTIILTESNNIYACGSNTDGQLGLDNVDMVNTPTKLQCNHLQESGTIKKLSAGSQHSAALTENGLVYLWGSNSEGQLGLESNRSNSKIPVLLEFKDKIRDISCGYYHTAILTENGQLFTFGENENGKLGLPQSETQAYKPTRVHIDIPLTSVTCGGNHNIALTETGTAIAFGSNLNGELGFDKDVTWISEPRILPVELFENEKLFMVACGDNHTAFVTENSKIYTCGDTRHGKLCEDTESEDGHYGPQPISRFTNYKVTNVACGGCHTIICAQKNTEETNSTLPPLQRVPNSIIHSEILKIENTVNDDDLNKFVREEFIPEIEENTRKLSGELSDNMDKLPENISDIIKSQTKQLDDEYKKTIETIKHESHIVEDKVNDTIEIVKTEVSTLKDLPADSTDNILQDIEDDLSSKSGKTVTSDTISVKSNEEPSVKTTIEVEEIISEDRKSPENDDEDLKIEEAPPQNERKLSKLFGTFKRKKISSTATLDSKILDTNDASRKNSTDTKKQDEIITVQKSEKIKTCVLI